jgi:hypothetical protein
MDPKNAAIAALAVGLAIQTSRARFYRKDAERLSGLAKTWNGVAMSTVKVLRRDLTDQLFEEIVKDF